MKKGPEKTAFGINLDAEVVKKVDARRGLASRSSFINHILKEWLKSG